MRESNEKVEIVKEDEVDYKEINEKIGLNNIKVETRPLLTINSWCHNHIKALHKEYPNTEWLAICKVENLGNGHFEVVDMIHPEQKTTSGEVETTDDGMDWAVDYLIEKKEDLSKWNLILHSHHHMGVFRSGTDDNARKKLNDGRTLAWAVVTAYSGDTISYKGCLNFYKPYPIEIDCDIEYEVEDLLGQKEQWGKYIKDRTQEIYNDSIKTDERLNTLQCEYNYDRLLEYLGIDITKELEENAKVVSMKMPCPEYEERLKELMDIARQKVQEEIGEATDKDLELWEEWNDYLMEQLKEAKEVKANTPVVLESTIAKPYNYDYDYDYGFYSQCPTLLNNRDFDSETYNDFYMYNTTNFTKSELIDMLGLNEQFHLMANEDGLWLIYNSTFDRRMYIGDCLDDIYQYEDDYL